MKTNKYFVAVESRRKEQIKMRTKTIKTKLLTALLTLCMLLSLVPISVFAAEPTTIDEVNFTFEAPSLKAGDAPKTWASVMESDAHYKIYDEYFVECEDKPGETNVLVRTGREWHSDPIAMSRVDTDKQLTAFEAGKTYLYYIVLEPEDLSNYRFTENTEVYLDKYIELGTPKDSSSLKLVDMGLRLQYSYWVCLGASDGKEEQTITSAAVQNVKFDYQPGDAPQATAEVPPSSIDPAKYEIAYECWQEFENNEPVAAWYSDGGSHGSLPTITKFESGKEYVYSVMLKPKDGYSFSKDVAMTVNWESVKSSLSGDFLYAPAVKTITMPTIKVIDVVEINGVTVSFKDGDKPVFTGKVPDGANYAYRCEWWELDGTTGAMSTDFGNFYENKITAFEAGKTYHYGVYVTTYGDVGNVRYVFGPDTKLKINGEFVNYKRYEGDESDGSDGTMWVITDLTMTPQASGTTPDYRIIEGANGSWTQNSDRTLAFRTNGNFSEFIEVKVDGSTVSADNYTVSSETAAITLKAEYLNTLSVGKHTVTIVFNDGECSAEFEVKAAENTPTTVNTDINNDGNKKPNKVKPGTENTENPKTGSESNFAPWIALLFISGGVLTGSSIATKKKKHNK